MIVQSIVENHKNIFRHTIFWATYDACSTSVFNFIMMIFSITLIFLTLLHISSSLFCADVTVWLRHNSYSLFVNGIIFFFSNLIIFIACYLKYLQNFFVQFLPLYTSCWFSSQSIFHIGNVEYFQGKASFTFNVHNFLDHFYIDLLF